jgi:hypothetical protein
MGGRYTHEVGNIYNFLHLFSGNEIKETEIDALV